MSTIRIFSIVYGIAFLLVGLLGFCPVMLTQPVGHAGHELSVRSYDGYLFGLFHVNILHSLVHVLFGVLGLAMATSNLAALRYARIVGVSYLLLAVMGLIPGLNTVFGLIPIHGHDVWLHLLLALPALYFGFAAAPREAHVRTVVTPPHP